MVKIILKFLAVSWVMTSIPTLADINRVAGRTAFDILGVRENSSREERQTAYRKLYTQLHADRGGQGDSDLLALIGAAKTVTNDNVLNRIYLRYLEVQRSRREPIADWGHFKNYTREDWFRQAQQIGFILLPAGSTARTAEDVILSPTPEAQPTHTTRSAEHHYSSVFGFDRFGSRTGNSSRQQTGGTPASEHRDLSLIRLRDVRTENYVFAEFVDSAIRHLHEKTVDDILTRLRAAQNSNAIHDFNHIAYSYEVQAKHILDAWETQYLKPVLRQRGIRFEGRVTERLMYAYIRFLAVNQSFERALTSFEATQLTQNRTGMTFTSTYNAKVALRQRFEMQSASRDGVMMAVIDNPQAELRDDSLSMAILGLHPRFWIAHVVSLRHLLVQTAGTDRAKVQHAVHALDALSDQLENRFSQATESSGITNTCLRLLGKGMGYFRALTTRSTPRSEQ